MADEWRRKKYYKTRVLISTVDILDSQFPDTIICITGAQVEMLRNLTQYLHRRSTFSQGYTNDYYLAPDNDDWDVISALVADLEEVLMGCDIETLVTAIEVQTAIISTMTDCICALSSTAGGVVPGTVSDTGSALAPDLATETAIAGIAVPGTDILKCELANVLWGFTSEFITETLLPFANGVADATTAAIAATTLFAVISGGLGLSLALVTAAFAAVVQFLLDSATTNLINWMVGNGQEMVCELYLGLTIGGYELAASRATTFIDESGLPLGDKMMLKLTLTSTWFYRAMQYQIDQLAIDPDDYFEYECGSCSIYDYFWDGADCPNGTLTGSQCRFGYPSCEVATTCWTLPPHVAYVSGMTGYACSWEASGHTGQGGTINMFMRRASDSAIVATHQFVVTTSQDPQQFSHTFDPYPGDSIKFTWAGVGASVASLYWLGLDIET